MAARRCGTCATNWPIEYRVCPECDEPTWIARNLTPISKAVALSRKLHVDFERYYEEREAKRQEE